MNNYYQLLGVTRGASASVVKIAYEGKLKTLKASGLTQAQQEVEARELERAYVTLSNPAKATWYDGQLDKQAAPEPASSMRSAGAVTAVLALILAGGASAWYFQDRAAKREAIRVEGLRIEAEQKRVALEREREEYAKELELAKANPQSRTLRYDVRVKRDDREMALIERAYTDQQAYRSEVQKRNLQGYDTHEAERQADRDRRLADEERRKALAEVERQKRWVKEREAEEERARIMREQRARQDQYERQRREAIEALKQSSR